MSLTANWSYPTAIRFGAGRLAELPEACAAAGIKRPLLVTDRGLAAMEITTRALDILEAAGLGRALFEAVRGPLPFTCTVLDGNERARRFYARLGGRHLATRPEVIGASPITEHLYGWDAPGGHFGQQV